MILDEATLIEIQDYINKLDEDIGLSIETIEDIRKAISKKKRELKCNHRFFDIESSFIQKRKCALCGLID
jgi:hypothetical protein